MLLLVSVTAMAKEFSLHQAVLDNNSALVKRLLGKGAAIDEIGSRKYGYGSPLHLAVRGGHLDIARLLLDRGAQVDVLDLDDFTPLHNAAWNGNLEMTELLLAAGADIEASTYDGDTPLSLAQNNNQPKVAEFIQAKLQASSGVDTKVELTPSTDYSVVDVTGTYVADFLATDKTTLSTILYDPKSEEKPIVEIVQNRSQITGTWDDGRGKIWGEINDGTIKFDYTGPRASTGYGTWKVKSGGNEITGKFYSHSGLVPGEWNLTKIENDSAPVIDVSGTYSSEVTGPYRSKLGLNGANPEVKLVQEGSKVTGTFESGGKLWGDVNGDSIELDYFSYGYQGKVSWKVKPGSNEVVGTWAYKETLGKDGNWNLTKIDADD